MRSLRNFSGSPVAKTPSSKCREPRCHPWLGNSMPKLRAHMPKLWIQHATTGLKIHMPQPRPGTAKVKINTEKRSSHWPWWNHLWPMYLALCIKALWSREPVCSPCHLAVVPGALWTHKMQFKSRRVDLLRVLYVRKGYWASWLNISFKVSFPGGSNGKEFACSVGEMGLIPGSGRSPGGGHGHPLQYPCLENPHGVRSLVGAAVHRVSKSWTWLSD